MTAQTTPTTTEFTVTEDSEVLHITHNDTGLEFVAVPYEDRTDEGELITEWYETTLTENGKVWATKLDIELVYDVIRDYVERMAIVNAPVIELDMANIANLFFAIELSQTAFRSLHNGDELEISDGLIYVSTKIGYIKVFNDDYATMQITAHWTNTQNATQRFLLEVQRLSKIQKDIQNHFFKAPYLWVKWEATNCPF